jgi:alcohol dehydrogenase class IV
MTQEPRLSFVHEGLPQRVLFGAGTVERHLAAEVARLGAARVLLVASGRDADLVARLSGVLPVVLHWSEVRQHVAVELAERARAAAEQADVDLLVSVGGGSTTGLAKAVALTTGLPVIAVPTTYAGSEATDVWGLTEDGVKRTGTDPRVLPRSIVYDPDLTVGLPVALTVASGLNAMAHCVDSLWAPRADPVNRALALEGARSLASGLPAVVADPAGAAGRETCLLGAHLAAVAFTSAGSGLHHKVAHVLGGTYGLPHAETHAVVLPYVLALNSPGVPALARRLADALGATDGDPVQALDDLVTRLSGPRALRDLGMREADLDDAAERIARVVPDGNPVPVDEDRLATLLRAAWAGDRPGGLSARRSG